MQTARRHYVLVHHRVSERVYIQECYLSSLLVVFLLKIQII